MQLIPPFVDAALKAHHDSKSIHLTVRSMEVVRGLVFMRVSGGFR